MTAPTPLALRLYLGASFLATVPLRSLLRRRASRGKEEAARLNEREGYGADRPADGCVVWAHGASVGEVKALLGLLETLRSRVPGVGGVVTTGTVTGADVAEGALPHGFTHRYAPLDALPWVTRFLDDWRPDIALRVDSEIWPCALHRLRQRGVPTLLLNGRLSESSAAHWRRLPDLARYLAQCFAAIGAQDEASAARFRSMGAAADAVTVLGSLKAAAVPPDADPEALSALRTAIGARPVWLAASVQPQEDATIIAAAKVATAQMPGLLTLIVPRHPERGPAVATAALEAGLTVGRRQADEAIDGRDVYVADTLGEMGLWYRLAAAAFIGGTLQPLGGHNPYEPAMLGVALAAGPSRFNFEEAYAALEAADACQGIASTDDLVAFIIEAVDGKGTRSMAAEEAGARGAAALAIDRRPLEAAADLVARWLPQP